MNSILVKMEDSQSRRKEWPVTLRALRHHNFRLYFCGQMISLIGTWMEPVAASWLVYRLTGSSLMLGTVAFASQLPTFLLAPLGGVVADRYDRRSILIVTQFLTMIFTLILAGLTLTHVVQVWPVILLVALVGVVNAFDIPTHQAFTLDMVSREDLVNAIALNSSIFNGARMIGPALGGVLVAKVGEGWCFFANGLSFLAVIAGLLLMTAPQSRPPLQGSRNTIEGFRFVTRTAPVRALMLLLGLISFIATPCVVLMPVFADQVLHGGARGLGLLMGAPGVGALCGAIMLATRKSVSGLPGWIAVACNCFGVALVLFSLSRSFWLSMALLVFAGFSVTLEMASSNTLIQSMVPDHLRGRVMSLYSTVFMGMVPLSALVAGSFAHAIGAPATVALAGGISIIGGIVFATRLPVLRPATRELLAVQEMSVAPAQEITTPVFSGQREAG
ncbi:MAG: MFS transporter [Candidatus Angelobacter sp. Gp1-AA117]|nr:MAG: MFS transporter [Candidatus Angelobacter sp. Gp1-AA117]